MTDEQTSPSAVPRRALGGRTAIVTGSTSGIGLGIARALAGCGAVEEIGAVAAFLCSGAARPITGAALPVDGGWTAH